MTMAENDAQTLGLEVWRGGVNTWECDEMGHLNVRFYVTRALEGLVGLAAALGLSEAYVPGAVATLVLREQHIRFLREARPAARLHMRAGVLAIGETEAQVLQVLYHADTGAPAASFVSRISHVTAGDARPFPWPRKALERAAGLNVALPDYAAPRGLSLAPFESQASLTRARALGIGPIAAGAIGPQDVDAFGRMRAEQFIGRVSDGVGLLAAQIREIVASAAPKRPERFGGAVLEYRLVYLDWPRAGQRLVVHSGLAGADSRTQRLIHWLLDPETGKAWGVSEAIAATLDLDARKLVAATPEAVERLSAFAVPGLGL
jgi:acyl-CoA thioester hydrolase